MDPAKADPYGNLVKALNDYFVPQLNLTYERYKFRKLSQEGPVLAFVNELHNVAKNCDFDNKTVDSIYNQNIRDQLVLGLASDDLRRRLLAEKDLTLEKAIRIAVAYESSADKVDDIARGPNSSKSSSQASVLALRSRSSSPRYRPTSNRSRSKGNVSFSVVTCYYCKKPGHMKKNCYKLKNTRKSYNANSVSHVFGLTEPSSAQPLKEVDCSFFNEPLKAIVDTGASISVVSKDFVKRARLTTAVVKTEHQAKLPNGNTMNFGEGINGPLVIGDCNVEAFFYVAACLPCDCLVGMNVLKLFKTIKINENGPDLILSLLPEPLSEFSDVFDRPLNDACCLKKPAPIIELSADTQPFQCKVRQHSARDKQVCKEQVEKLLQQGVIEKSRSPWRHAPVVVTKRSGGFRMAVDYRPVNSFTKMDAYPVPNVQELLQRLEGCKYFSSLDFSQFYYQQLPLHPDDREKTAFYVDGELYQFKRCSFGLKNAVSYCTRVMHDLFRGKKGISIYLDDILCHAETKVEHDEILRNVLTIIRQNNLSLNMNKCSFYQEEVSFLGHRISCGNIMPDPERTRAISHAQFNTPKSKKELQRFLGMCNHFRNYISGFASISKELYGMCADEVNELTWTDSSIKAFNALKDQTAKSVLVLPPPSEKLKLCTDASQDCVGACLLTEVGQPVSFASKKLTPSQCRWSTIEKEAFAVVWSVQKLRSFLLGKHFTVFSDHQPLKYLLQANNVSPKVLRWRAMVGEFDFDVKYIPGGENVIADSLSRVFSVADVDADSEIQLSQETFLEFQKKDPECQALYKTVAREYTRRPHRVSHVMWSLKKKLTIKQSLLHVNNKIFVPLKLRTRVLTATHYGHQGIENMQRKLSADYFWPNMKKNVHDFVRNCRICSMIKPKFVNAQLKPYLLDAPLQLVVTDYIGPLPSDIGFRYILVILDAFSRFPEVYPVKDMSANTLIAKFRDYFARYGFPDAILSDNGTQFRSKEFQSYCARFNIKKKFTNTYRPSSNGI